MSEITVRPLILGSDVEILRLIACEQAMNAELYFDAELNLTVEGIRGSLTDTPFMRHVPWVAVSEAEDGQKEIVGKLFIGIPLQGDVTAITAFVHVRKEYRHRGIGTAFAQVIQSACQHSGRTNLKVFGYASVDNASKDLSIAWPKFAQRLGLKLENESTTSILTVPDYQPSWSELQFIVDENIGDYKIELWDAGIPEEYLESYGALLRIGAGAEGRAQKGEEIPHFSPSWIRSKEQQLRENGYAQLVAVAFDREGALVAYSELIYRLDGSTLANQIGTLVAEKHRGKKLGMALKLATHQGLYERVPSTVGIAAIDADSSVYNANINDRLGYWPAFKSLIFSNAKQP